MTSELNPSRRANIAKLIQDETHFLNQGDLASWMALFSEDGFYWMPLEPGQTSPHEHDSLIFDNRALMEMRQYNLGHALSPSMQVPVRSVRILAEPQYQISQVKEGAVDVSSSVIAVIYHRRQDTFAGNVTYTVVGEDQPRIYCKRVDLINADGDLDAIMMYI